MLTAVVPLRGGSKSIPDKNIKEFCGKPLCEWVLTAALECPEIGQVIVSTDSAKIAKIVAGIDKSIVVRSRPAHLAGDLSMTEDTLLDAIVSCSIRSDHIVTIQATSPQTTATDLSSAIRCFVDAAGDSLVTGSRVKRFFWNDDGTPLNYDPAKRPMRQSWAGTIMENGAFYISRRDRLQSGEARLHGKVVVFEMLEWAGTELDEVHDWVLLERAFREMRQI